jgi:hypothetical protein
VIQPGEAKKKKKKNKKKKKTANASICDSVSNIDLES